MKQRPKETFKREPDAKQEPSPEVSRDYVNSGALNVTTEYLLITIHQHEKVVEGFKTMLDIRQKVEQELEKSLARVRELRDGDIREIRHLRDSYRVAMEQHQMHVEFINTLVTPTQRRKLKKWYLRNFGI